MKLDMLLGRSCIQCPPPPPCMACTSNETCVQIVRSCTTCYSTQCVANSSPPSSSGGISGGAVAGAVVGILVLVAAAGFFFWWYRRRTVVAPHRRNDEPMEAPARAEDVLNRPDPNEMIEVAVQQRTFQHSPALSNGTADPNTIQIYGQALGSPAQSRRDSVGSNPFEDGHSIQTTSTGTQSTNVIPIALVAPCSTSTSSGPSNLPSSGINPSRPERSPDMDLNLDHLNVSSDGSRTGTPGSQVSGGVMEISNKRESFLSSMSSASDFLNEVPMIVTPMRGNVRQIMGVGRAEVIQAPAPPGSSMLSVPASSRTVRSPLAGSSFGPADLLKDIEEEHESSSMKNPFGDDGISLDQRTPDQSPAKPLFSAQPPSPLLDSEWSPTSPALPWARSSDDSRPTSVSTQDGSIIADIGSATRVQVGLQQLTPRTLPMPTPTTADTSRSLHRMTSARLVPPPTSSPNSNVGALEQQQQEALKVARRDRNRVSGGSLLSTTSTKADSILESFPFVPPSPISDRPTRTPPRSPLAQQSSSADEKNGQPSPPLPTPPDRRALGISSGSQISTMSAGLGAFPFQLDPTPQESAAQTPTSVNGRQRASLDTLALTSDLTSYPLGFDKELQDNYPLQK